MPVSSAIMSPVDKAVIIHDRFKILRRWAIQGVDIGQVRVEVSGDGGSIWYEAPLDKLSEEYFYAWRTSSINLLVDAEGGLELELRCCCIHSLYLV